MSLGGSFAGESGVQVESDTPTRSVSPSTPEYIPCDILPGISTIQATVAVLTEANRSTLTALRSKGVFDGNAALDSVDTSMDALDTLEQTIKTLRNELHERRARVVSNINSVHNAKQPVMRLLPDVVFLVLDALAGAWRPEEKVLGWITITHVCVSWRRAALSLPSLWARELNTYLSPEGFHEILSRARSAPLTLSSKMEDIEDDIPEYLWRTLSQSNSLRALDLNLTHQDAVRLANILNHRPSLDVESFSIVANANCTDITFPSTVSLPYLRFLFLEDIYIPFHAPNIRELFLYTEHVNSFSFSCTAFLDILEQCPNIVYLRLFGWAPMGVPHSSPQVQLSRLQTLEIARIDSDSNSHYMDLCQFLDLPVLRYVELGNYPESALSTLSRVFQWLHRNKQPPPCVTNVSSISISLSGVFDSSFLDVCLDGGSSESTKVLFDNELPADSGTEGEKGVRVQINKTGAHQAVAYDSTFFDCVVAGCLNLWGHSTILPMLQNAHFNFGGAIIDWHSVLRHLVHLENLHVLYRALPTLLPALAQAGPDGSMLLPRLKTITCGEYIDSARQFQASEAERVRHMLKARAENGIPVALMKSITREEKADEEGDVFFARLVSVYI